MGIVAEKMRADMTIRGLRPRTVMSYLRCCESAARKCARL